MKIGTNFQLKPVLFVLGLPSKIDN